MGFKEQLILDLDTLMSSDEFSETHTIDGRELTVLVDNDQLKERSKKEYDGISVGEILFFVKASDYGELPEAETPLIFDKRQMYVFNAREHMGMYEIILSQNRSG
ncbi:hypothetical protein [Desulfosporosinus sp. OT]|uniref:hypothetical protein n=1 Tax=Desulfosporosinus sp. OT TaxID=913865 RepID=UPI000223A5D9|nr:hypothetical protein [Desulfosporosinus sp. OT]EGW39166.1 hypothetical protein DOT_2899 [Desulfosporosinus sp. OT]